MTLREGEEYIAIDCGCKFNNAHYEDVIFVCDKHKTWDDIKLDIASYVRGYVRKIAYENH